MRFGEATFQNGPVLKAIGKLWFRRFPEHVDKIMEIVESPLVVLVRALFRATTNLQIIPNSAVYNHLHMVGPNDVIFIVGKMR